jgi:GYD domain
VGILDLPDNVSMAAVNLTVAATGLVDAKTTVLLTPEEVNDAARRSVSYRGSGE